MTKTIRQTLPYLARMIGSHQFRFKSDQGIKHTNFKCQLSDALILQNSDGSKVKIPNGSDLVVYRHPTQTLDNQKTVACFHHTGGAVQTVIYGGGRTVTQQLGRRSLIDGGRRMPRLYLTSD